MFYFGEVEVMKESLIGKYYIPNDNSYSVNLTTSTQYPYNNEQKYLAGTYNTDAKICLIVSEPFMCKVRTVLNQISEIMMILVEYDNEVISVIFYEHLVMDDKIMSNGVPVIWDDEG